MPGTKAKHFEDGLLYIMQQSRHPTDAERHTVRNFACISVTLCNMKTPYGGEKVATGR